MHNNGSTPSSYIFFSLNAFPSSVSFFQSHSIFNGMFDVDREIYNFFYICINTCLFTLHYILLSSQQYPCAPFFPSFHSTHLEKASSVSNSTIIHSTTTARFSGTYYYFYNTVTTPLSLKVMSLFHPFQKRNCIICFYIPLNKL